MLKMSRKDEVFKPALSEKKIPILTLDNKWHRLFTQTKQDKKIKLLEEEVNALLRRRGKLTGELKEIQKLKKTLLDGIVNNAEGASVENNEKAIRKAEESTRLIGECNDRLKACEDELISLPEELERLNKELMLQTMESCYETLHQNQQQIKEDEEWIEEARKELKMRLVRKQDLETMNQALYSYMHDIFGAEVIELFDKEYGEEQ